MADNLMDTQLNEYLMDIQSEITATLKYFDEHGVTINEEIEEYLLKTSNDCVKQEFNRFKLKSKLKEPSTKSSLSTAGVDNSSMVITSGASKRDSKDGANGNVERLKRKRRDEPNSTSGQNVDVAANVTKMIHTLFYCVHCVDLNDPSKSFRGSKNDVYQHWVAMHKEDFKPFEFHVVPLLRCFHCGKTDVYHDLVKHHQEQHSSQRFMVVDRIDKIKCGICQYKDGNLLEHFRMKHASDITLKIFNPIAYSEQQIDELLTINLHQNFHSGQKPGCYLICGHCQKKVDCDKYLNHFNEHKYKFSCSQCAYYSADLVELVLHEKITHNFYSLDHHCREFAKSIKKQHLNTRLVFGNCLILQNWNVVGTKYDAGKHFRAFIGEFLDKKKEEVNRRLEMEKSTTAPSMEAMQTNNKEIDAELNAQRKLVDTVFVSCIPTILDEFIDPYEIFLKMCQILELNVCRDDIEEIYRNYSGLVVKFHRIAIKEMVLKKSDGKFVWSNDLFQMEEGRTPWRVRIRYHLTPFYCNLWKETAKCQQQNRGYTFRMSNDGISIRSKATSIEYIINTKDELQEFLLK